MVRKGYFGDFGGMFVPELLMPPLLELEKAYHAYTGPKPDRKNGKEDKRHGKR